MRDNDPTSAAKISGHPIHPILVPFPIVRFVGAFVSDLVYWRSAEMMWETFSVWLISGGLIMGGLAAIAGLIDFASSRQIRSLAPAWPHVLGNALVLLLR